MLHIDKLNKTFGNQQVLKNIQLSISKGSIAALLGPNGCGKSTLLKCLLGISHPDEKNGLYNIKGLDDFSIAYMPQNPSFPKYLSVAEVIFFR